MVHPARENLHSQTANADREQPDCRGGISRPRARAAPSSAEPSSRPKGWQRLSPSSGSCFPRQGRQRRPWERQQPAAACGSGQCTDPVEDERTSNIMDELISLYCSASRGVVRSDSRTRVGDITFRAVAALEDSKARTSLKAPFLQPASVHDMALAAQGSEINGIEWIPSSNAYRSTKSANRLVHNNRHANARLRY